MISQKMRQESRKFSLVAGSGSGLREFYGYGIALLSVALALAVKFLLDPFLKDQAIPFLLFFFGVLISSWYGGLKPGLFATFIASIAGDYFFLSPGAVIWGNSSGEILELGLFILEGVLISIFSAARKRAEEERARLLISEQQAREAAEIANRSKDQFLAVVSHELRTPLTAILGWARLLRTGDLDEATLTRALEAIERNTKVQTQLVEDLLDVSRIISGKLHLELRPVDLREVIESAVDSVRPSALAKNIRIDVVSDHGLFMTSGDSNRLQQIIWNLLSNSLKFTPTGGRIEIKLKREDPFFSIVVSDTGKGISPNFLPHVFDRFRQADDSLKKHGGLGLGLAIVRHLVDLHGGELHAYSPGEGKGAVFTVKLPIEENEEKPTMDRNFSSDVQPDYNRERL
jgi:signal transduction histidine kinase